MRVSAAFNGLKANLGFFCSAAAGVVVVEEGVALEAVGAMGEEVG